MRITDSKGLFAQYNPNDATRRREWFDGVSEAYESFFDCLKRKPH
jgi:hypothetical protein